MTEKKSITISNTVKFAEDMVQAVTQGDFASYGKADMYDCILYLLNKHSAEKFLDTYSNFDNSRMLKITEQRVKMAKKNISLKFMDTAEFDSVFDTFIQKISGGQITPRDTGDYYNFTIEDTVLRSILEAKLKETVGETFTHKLNTEQVSIAKKDFLEMLAHEKDKDVQKFLADAKSKAKDTATKKLFDEFLANAVDALPYAKLTVSAVKALCAVASK